MRAVILLLDWLGINSIQDAFAIMNGGVLSVPSIVANKILDFVSWFNQEVGVSSGGQAVGEIDGGYAVLGSNIDGKIALSSVVTEGSDRYYTFTFNNVHCIENNSYGFFWLVIPISTTSATFSLRIMSMTITNNYPNCGMGKGLISSITTYKTLNKSFTSGAWADISMSSGYDSVYLVGRTFSNSSINGNVELLVPTQYSSSVVSAIVTPSTSVSVPPVLEEEQSILITTSAEIADTDSQEEACEAILDSVTSQDGLTATNTVQAGASASWGWLSDILDSIYEVLFDIYYGITSIPSAIGTAIQNAVSGISATVSSILTFCKTQLQVLGKRSMM